MPVIALQDYDRKKEIKTFVDINSKQQRIDGNLILLLKADLEWKEGTTEFKQKVAVGVADELNHSFFKNRIYFGMADEPKGKKITLTTLVSSMISNDLVQDTISHTNKKLKEIFSFMLQYMSDYSFKEDTYFGQNRGISVLFRLVNLVQRNMQAQKMNVSKDIFFQDLSKLFNKQIIENLDNYYGEGGANAAATLLITELKTKYPIKYGRIETNLNLLRESIRKNRK